MLFTRSATNSVCAGRYRRILSSSRNPLMRTRASVAVGDFNGDGLWDLAVANVSPSLLIPGPVSILLENGDGTFGPADNVPAGVSPQSVVVADFNGDGFSDLAVGNRRSHNFSVLLGRGDGTFRAAQHFGPGNDPIPLAVGDFNGDGLADLVAPHSGTSRISVLISGVLEDYF